MSAQWSGRGFPIEPTTVYITVQEDRHQDTQVWVYTTPEAALHRALRILDTHDRNSLSVPAEGSRMTKQELDEAGWMFWASYGPEGDCVRVQAIELDDNE